MSMQDRCAGDVGDFFKLGLLRWLVSPCPDTQAHRLGVVWYRMPDEYHSLDGTSIDYLDPTSAVGQNLRPLDPDLYDRLRRMVETGKRSISALVSGGALPAGSVSYEQVLTLAGRAPRDPAVRAERRQRWFDEAVDALDPCSLVFVDPDNGLQRDDAATCRSRSEKNACLSEVGRFLERGQSVVAHHHADRPECVADQAMSRMAEIRDQLGVDPLAAVQAARGTTRLYIVIPDDRHRSGLEARLRSLQLSPWGSELRLHRWSIPLTV